MAALEDRCSELASLFPNQVIVLEVMLETADVWSGLEQASMVLRENGAQLMKLSNCGQAGLFFRVNCPSHETINDIRNAFDQADGLSILRWTIELRRPEPASADTKACNYSKSTSPRRNAAGETPVDFVKAS